MLFVCRAPDDVNFCNPVKNEQPCEMGAVIVLPLQKRTCRRCKVVPYPGSVAGGWSGERHTKALAHFELVSKRTFPRTHSVLGFWLYPEPIWITRTRTGLQLTD